MMSSSPGYLIIIEKVRSPEQHNKYHTTELIPTDPDGVYMFEKILQEKNMLKITLTQCREGGVSYLPIQNLLNTFDKTSSDISSPLICPRDNAASLKSIVQKSRGSSSFIDDCNLVSASFVRTSCSHCLCIMNVSNRQTNNDTVSSYEAYSKG